MSKNISQLLFNKPISVKFQGYIPDLTSKYSSVLINVSEDGFKEVDSVNVKLLKTARKIVQKRGKYMELQHLYKTKKIEDKTYYSINSRDPDKVLKKGEFGLVELTITGIVLDVFEKRAYFKTNVTGFKITGENIDFSLVDDSEASDSETSD